MALDKAIEKGQEHRRQYYGAKAIDRTCRNHGGNGKRHSGWQCPACLENRLIQSRKENDRTDLDLRDYRMGE